MKFQTTALFFLATAASASATNFCPNSPITFVAGVSDDDKGLTESFETFRTLLGGENNGSEVDPNGGFKEGHRSINWDADAVPFDMPGDFFAATVTRGLTVKSNNNRFAVSNPPAESGILDNNFDSINPTAAEDFQTFSPKRLFTPLGQKAFAIEFSVPGDVHKAATVEGFGAVFADVDRAHTTIMTWYAPTGCILAQKAVDPKAEGLSFLGAVSRNPNYPIGKVVVQLGLNIDSYQRGDWVVLDDFLYSEPQAYTKVGK